MTFLDSLRRVAAYLYDPAGNSLIGATGGVKVEGVSGGVRVPTQAGTGLAAQDAIPDYGVAYSKDANNADRNLAVEWELFNGTTRDRVKSIAASGAGIGVQRVGTMGELVTLAASAARTTSANGTAVTGLGWRGRYLIQLDLTAAATDATDTLDVFVDVSVDGTNQLNAVHFTQCLGTGGAKRFFAVLDPANPGALVIDATADAAVGVVRPSMFGTSMRARWAIVDTVGADVSFTFSVVAWAI